MVFIIPCDTSKGRGGKSIGQGGGKSIGLERGISIGLTGGRSNLLIWAEIWWACELSEGNGKKSSSS